MAEKGTKLPARTRPPAHKIRGERCACGRRAVDYYRRRYVCARCLNPPIEEQKSEDRVLWRSPLGC